MGDAPPLFFMPRTDMYRTQVHGWRSQLAALSRQLADAGVRHTVVGAAAAVTHGAICSVPDIEISVLTDADAHVGHAIASKLVAADDGKTDEHRLPNPVTFVVDAEPLGSMGVDFDAEPVPVADVPSLLTWLAAHPSTAHALYSHLLSDHSGKLPTSWIHGLPDTATPEQRALEPKIQVHWLDDHMVIMRQSKALHYEGNFMFLLFGATHAILFDTGATEDDGFPLRSTVDDLITAWEVRHKPAAPLHLIVAHTHSHDDHVAADRQFVGRPHTTIVPHGPEAVAAFYGFTGWPQGVASLSLGGGSQLSLFPILGHEAAHLAVYVHSNGVLLTGDVLYPGRLYVRDGDAFRNSAVKLRDWVLTHPVTHILGCHIEMTATHNVDYPTGTTYQPDEAPYSLEPEDVLCLHDAVAHNSPLPTPRLCCGRFIIVPK